MNTISFSKHGDLIVSGSDDGTVKIWNVETQNCLETLKGHISNVFAADFMACSSNKEIVSGGNDADLRYYDLEKKTCTIYSHHTKKILRISKNPHSPNTFLSCSSDGTIRKFDIRLKYSGTTVKSFDEYSSSDGEDYVLPQAFGGGRVSRIEVTTDTPFRDSLVLDYRLDKLNRHNKVPTLYSVDFHPDGNRFIVGSSIGDVRLFDLRKIVDNPSKSCINIYKNYNIRPNQTEISGCVFSRDGSEIVATALNDFIYVWDIDKDYSKELNLNFLAPPERPPVQEEEDDGDESSSDDEIVTYKKCYKGHISSKTIKGVNFYGPNSEFLISGSDDGHIYIWDKKTGQILQILKGHQDIVNSIATHPTEPLFASSGIEDIVKLWRNDGEYPTPEVLERRRKNIDKIAAHNIELSSRQIPVFEFCAQQ